ncbi:MAG TPA: hypothetical protein VJ672_08290 [Gemmatimonadaceae bacterium]|nr:hypothetical protein [Gemmatimonadaceae bacterium]
MYSTCLFCNNSLGSNESVEHFPIGRRLAFDAAKGRLWVVCRKCERWNLSPIEERWEAIEECERLFRDTRLRVSTDNIGLAKLREGLELIRIGEPQRPEFAAWRYGDQFGRRRRIRIAKAALGVGALGAVVAGGAMVGVGIGGFGWFLWQWAEAAVKGSPEKVVARVPFESDTIKVKRKHLQRVSLEPSEDDAPFALRLKYRQRHVLVTGEPAVKAAGVLLPHINQFGASRHTVEEAVARIEHAGDSAHFMRGTAARAANGQYVAVAKLEPGERLALEMALHEESERRALEGELAALEAAWRDAEEIAAISDNLLLPSGIQELVGKLSGRG